MQPETKTAIDVHVHDPGPGDDLSAHVILAAPFVVAIIVYVAAAVGQRGWPWHRTAAWVAGVIAAYAAFGGPLASASHQSFTAHMAAHLLVGMVAPLLLVLAAPVTLALRTMSVVPARRLSRVLRSPLARALVNPVVAALLNVGALWALYLTPLYALMRDVMLVHVLVMLHFLFAGCLYTVALVPIDPSPHKAGFAFRAAVLVLSLAAHGALAKLLYARPPPGIAATDAHIGAQLMYYGGDAVDLVLIVLLCAEWYRTSGRRLPAGTVSRPTGVSAPTISRGTSS